MDESYRRGNLLRSRRAFRGPILPLPREQGESPASFQPALHLRCSSGLAFVSVLQFFPYFGGRFARFSNRPDWKADGTHLRMPSSAVAFADGCQIMAQRFAHPRI